MYARFSRVAIRTPSLVFHEASSRTAEGRWLSRADSGCLFCVGGTVEQCTDACGGRLRVPTALHQCLIACGGTSLAIRSIVTIPLSVENCQRKLHQRDRGLKRNRKLTPLPINTCARCATSMSTACDTSFCSRVSSSSLLLPTCAHWCLAYSAALSLDSHEGEPLDMMYTLDSSLPAAVLRICSTRSTIILISG